ncbi:glutathione reductase [Scheffersomyces xylosifermentans]|uniref:glutathione reductase n=1 Tax=Scheffersomyces xylosifermentans TaxID=1304137 RepID=UPI00315C5077
MTVSENKYDFIIIGNGPSGIHAATTAAQLGQKVLIVATRLGGTCVNIGCIPKKILWESAKLISNNPFAEYLGIKKYSAASAISYGDVDWPGLTERRDAVSGGINTLYAGFYQKLGIDVAFGFGKFVNKDADVEVALNQDQTIGKEEYKKDATVTFAAKYVLVASGNQAVVPKDIPGSELGDTSDAFFEWKKQPKSVVIIGGGYIGTELSQILQTFGTKVTLAIRHDKILRRFDESIQDQLTKATEEIGVDLRKNVTVTKIEKSNNLKKVTFSDGTDAEAEEVIWTIGRKPLFDLGYKEAGIELGPTGGINVDGFNKTTNDKVYAVGDVLDKINLTPIASQSGTYIPRRLFGGAKIPEYDYDQPYPAVIFAHPEVGTIGLTTKQAEEKYGKDNIKTYEDSFASSFYQVAPQDKQRKNYYKYITAGEDEKVVGFHLIGDNVTEEIQGYVLGIKLGATRNDILTTIFVHPTTAEWKHHDF